MHLKERGCERFAGLKLTHDRSQWEAVMNVIMNVQVP